MKIYLFEKVELIPQAYELLLSQACGLDFRVSLDSFNQDVVIDRDMFTKKVYDMAVIKQSSGLPTRLSFLINSLTLYRNEMTKRVKSTQIKKPVMFTG